MTAQDLFRAMMRDGVAPRLRALGWKGSGQQYLLPDPQTWLQLDFQLSRFNTAASLRFTVNVSVVGKEAWTAYRSEQPTLPSRPKASTYYGPAFFYARIGDVLPAEKDIWWDLSAEHRPEDVDRVAEEVYVAVAVYAMPEIRRRIHLSDIPPAPAPTE